MLWKFNCLNSPQAHCVLWMRLATDISMESLIHANLTFVSTSTIADVRGSTSGAMATLNWTNNWSSFRCSFSKKLGILIANSQFVTHGKRTLGDLQSLMGMPISIYCKCNLLYLYGRWSSLGWVQVLWRTQSTEQGMWSAWSRPKKLY